MRILILIPLVIFSGCAMWDREVTTRAQEAAGKKAATEERLYCNTQSTGWYLRLPEARRQAFADYCQYLGYGGEGKAPELSDTE